MDLVSTTYRVKSLALHLSLILGVSFLIDFFPGNSELFLIMFFYAQAVAFFYSIKFLIALSRKTDGSKLINGVLAIVALMSCFLPVVLILIKSLLLKYLFVNISFFCFIFSSLVKHFTQVARQREEYGKNLETIAQYEVKLKELCAERSNQAAVISEYKKYFKLLEQEKGKDSIIEVLLSEYPDLTEREVAVAKLMAKGLSFVEIAEMLNVTDGGARSHSVKIYRKVGISGMNKKKKFIRKFTIKT